MIIIKGKVAKCVKIEFKRLYKDCIKVWPIQFYKNKEDNFVNLKHFGIVFTINKCHE